jgi:hypothetical protein
MLEVKRQTNKHVAHITTHRRNLNQPGNEQSGWDVGPITSEICFKFDDFIKEAPETNFDPTALRKMKKLLADWTSFASGGFLVSVPDAPTAPQSPFSMTAKTQSSSQ